MTNTTRMVNIRGYVKEVTVGHKKGTNYACLTSTGQTEFIPEHLFYHRENGQGLVLRGDIEFTRKYPNHPIEVESVSA